MPSRSYREWQIKKLGDPELAASYINAASNDSPLMFLEAIQRVAKARQEVSRVAKAAGIAREHFYRAFSDTGNPNYDTLRSTLAAIGLKIVVVPETWESVGPLPNPSAHVSRTAEIGVTPMGASNSLAQETTVRSLANVIPFKKPPIRIASAQAASEAHGIAAVDTQGRSNLPSAASMISKGVDEVENYRKLAL